MAHEFHVENAFSRRGALHDTTRAPSLTGGAHVALAPGVRSGNMGRSLPCQMRIFDNVCVLTKRMSNEGAKPWSALHRSRRAKTGNWGKVRQICQTAIRNVIGD